MIRLENIEKKDNIISAKVVTVEMELQVFEVAFNLKTNEIVKNTMGKMTMSVGMAIAKLIKLAEESGENLPKKTTSVWY